jgi:hypothetical protein
MPWCNKLPFNIWFAVQNGAGMLASSDPSLPELKHFAPLEKWGNTCACRTAGTEAFRLPRVFGAFLLATPGIASPCCPPLCVTRKAMRACYLSRCNKRSETFHGKVRRSIIELGAKGGRNLFRVRAEQRTPIVLSFRAGGSTNVLSGSCSFASCRMIANLQLLVASVGPHWCSGESVLLWTLSLCLPSKRWVPSPRE